VMYMVLAVARVLLNTARMTVFLRS